MPILKLSQADVTETEVIVYSVPKPGTYYLIGEADLDMLCRHAMPMMPPAEEEEVSAFELTQELSDMLPGEIDLTLDETGVKKFYNAKRAIIYQDGELSILYYSIDKAHEEGLI